MFIERVGSLDKIYEKAVQTLLMCSNTALHRGQDSKTRTSILLAQKAACQATIMARLYYNLLGH